MLVAGLYAAFQGWAQQISAQLDADPQPQPDPQPGPSPDGEDDSLIAVPDAAAITAALFAAGLLARFNAYSFTMHVIEAMKALGPYQGPPDLAAVRTVLDKALVAYSDVDGDGVADLPPITDAEAQTVLDTVLAVLATPTAPDAPQADQP